MTYWDLVVKEVGQRHSSSATFYFIPRFCQTNKLQPKKMQKKIYYPLGPKFPGIQLTAQEAECMKQASRGKTIQKIAKDLKLSPRTVEYYLMRMRLKLDCANKSELIEKILESDFFKNLHE